MYVFAQHGILSIVAHRDKPSMLMVRPPARADLAKLFPQARIVTMDDADYRHRVTLPVDVVAERVAKAVTEINYDRVKPSVRKDRQPTFLRAWSIMMDLQEQI